MMGFMGKFSKFSYIENQETQHLVELGQKLAYPKSSPLKIASALVCNQETTVSPKRNAEEQDKGNPDEILIALCIAVSKQSYGPSCG